MENQTKTKLDSPSFWRGALFGAASGMAALLVYQYFCGILSRPRLAPSLILSNPDDFETQEALTLFIASENLRSAIHLRRLANGQYKEILHAGYRNFRESWARDFSFAVYGLLALQQEQVVKETLEAFFWHQTPQGQFPVKLHSLDVVSRFLHSFFRREQPTELSLRPRYLSGHLAPSLDGQAMLVIAALTYVRHTQDREFLQKHWDTLKAALTWLEGHKRSRQDGWLYQQPYSDWADSIARHGHVLYTNVVYWKALCEMAQAAESLERPMRAAFYTEKANRVATLIQTQLWRADLGYFIASDTLEQLTSAGNLLAIVWNLASALQAQSILENLEITGMADPVPTQAAYPSYPDALIALENLLGGLANYHTQGAWLWLGSWHVIAQVKLGNLESARELLRRMATVIIRDKQVNEVYGPDGQPLSSRWYTSDAPLTWNAAMVIYACQVLEKALTRQPEVNL